MDIEILIPYIHGPQAVFIGPPIDERLVLCDVSGLYCVLCITHYRLCPCAREGPRFWSWQLVGASNNQH